MERTLESLRTLIMAIQLMLKDNPSFTLQIEVGPEIVSYPILVFYSPRTTLSFIVDSIITTEASTVKNIP